MPAAHNSATTLPFKSNVKVLSRDDQGRLYLKVFLIDTTLNGNYWGVDPSTVDDNIQTAIGKPLVLYRDTGQEPDRSWYPRIPGMYNHPPWDDADVNHTYEMQEQYRVGTIIDVVKNTETGAWWGIVEVTNDGVKKALNENPTLPFYVSPSIRRLHTQQANQTIRDWIFMHSAVVSIPAFGVQKAYSSGRCSGDKESCVLHFRNASLEQNRAAEKPDCGFCTYQAMLEIEEQMAIESVLDDWSDTEDVVVQEDETLNAAAKKKGPHAAARPDKQFAYVPKDAKGEEGTKSARKFPIYDAAHVRNALARFSQAKLPSGQKSAVLGKICRAARRFGIDSELCSKRSQTSNASTTTTTSLEDFGTNSQTNNLNTSHVTNSTNFEIGHNIMSSDSNTENVKKTENVVRNSTTIPEEQRSVVSEQRTTESVQQPQPQQPTTQQQSQVTVEKRQYPNPQATTVSTDTTTQNNDNTNNASAKSTKTNQLIDLLVQNERRQKQLQAAYHEINKLARDNQKLVQESTTSNTRLASLEKYIQEQQMMARENQIADIVYSASLAQFIPDEVKEEQVKLLVASPFKVEDIQKITAPWYSAFDAYLQAQKEGGPITAQVPAYTAPIAATTKVASQNVRLPLGSNNRDTNTKNAAQLPQQRNKSTKPAFLQAREYMGIVDTSNGGASY